MWDMMTMHSIANTIVMVIIILCSNAPIMNFADILISSFSILADYHNLCIGLIFNHNNLRLYSEFSWLTLTMMCTHTHTHKHTHTRTHTNTHTQTQTNAHTEDYICIIMYVAV